MSNRMRVVCGHFFLLVVLRFLMLLKRVLARRDKVKLRSDTRIDNLLLFIALLLGFPPGNSNLRWGRRSLR